jgi:AraC family transcriptional regulator, regulatory protein of adaptative response / methylated-DNA-[protein]-cysteine methyltransferase
MKNKRDAEFKSGEHGATSEVFHYGIAKSQLGIILAATTEKGVVSVLIGEDPATVTEDLRKRFPNAHLVRDDKATKDLTTQVAEYISSPHENLDFNLDVRGTAFQKKVWQAVRKLSVGQTTTYSALARAIGSPRAIRAVANACSINNLAFAIPCHRVLHKNRALSFGHQRGNDLQRAMVAREEPLKKEQ